MRVSELAQYIKATVHVPAGYSGDKDAAIGGLAPIEHAGPQHATFIASPDFERFAATTQAAVIIVAAPVAGCKRLQLLHKNPYWAFAKTAQLFFKPDHGPVEISPQAFIAADAEVGRDVTIKPFAYIGPRAKIGDRCVIYPGAYIGPDVVLGEETVVRANAIIENGVKIGKRGLVHGAAVIGGDGFGFAPGDEDLAKIPQVGSVVLGDDVEIGPGATVDRGAMSDTRIGDNSKLDSQAHVGHGCVIGRNTMMCGQSGLAGSAKLGDWVIIAGNSSVDSRCLVGDGVTIGAISGVTRDIVDKGVHIGFPAQPARDWRRQTVLARKLPEMLDRIKALEAKLADRGE